MGVEVRPVETLGDLHRFIELPWHIYRNIPQWVPPLRMVMKQRLDPDRHPFFEHGTAEYFLAWKDGRPAGRIAAIRNELHEWYHHEPVGFFGFLECIPDAGVARALFHHAMDWLHQRGSEIIRGPMNFSTNEEAGLLVEGFDRFPAVMMPYNPPYYAELLEQMGFKKAKDLWAWEVTRAQLRLDMLVQLRNRILRRAQDRLCIRTLEMRRLEEEAEQLRSIYNDAWSRNWGFVPMMHREFLHMAKELKPIADPDLSIVAEWEGRPVGFTIGVPDIHQVLRRIRSGRLFPLGWWHLLRGMRKITSFRVITLGVQHRFRLRGIDVLLIAELCIRGERRGYTHAEMSWILEDNHVMNRTIAQIGAERTKVYRIYERTITLE